MFQTPLIALFSWWRRGKTLALALVLVGSLAAAGATVAYAANPGDLDTTFDTDGKLTTPFGPNNDEARSVAIQADGKIVTAGSSFNGANNDFALARYNANGSLDTTFSGDGKLTTPIGTGKDIANSVAVQADGKIVAAGSSFNGANNDFALARYESVDTAPDTTITSGPSEGSTVSNTDQAFGFTSTESGGTFKCSINGAVFSACSSGDTFTFAGDSNTFEVKATDAAGNEDQSAATRSFTVDTTAPDTTITSGPSETTNSRSATFGFSSEAGASFQCKLDTGEFADCESGVSYENLLDGSHTFSVKAKDAAGNVDPTPASQTWTVDTTAPDTTAPTVSAKTPTGKNVPRTTNVTATFSENMDEGSVEAAGTVKLVKKGTTAPVTATVSYDASTKTVTLDPSAELKGRETYKATITTSAKDAAGNALAQDKTWTFTTGRR